MRKRPSIRQQVRYYLAKYCPEALTILNGLLQGMQSLTYICILLGLILYIYSVAGIIFFRINDPWHFRSVEIAMITLMRCAFFDGWGDVLYINYYGCEVYSMNVYTNVKSEDQHLLGGVSFCRTPTPQPLLICIYFFTYIFIVSFTIMSLIIGAIGDAMMAASLDMKRNSFALKIAWQQKDAVAMIKRYEKAKTYDRAGEYCHSTVCILFV